jgi:hypothetical protein
MPEDQDLIEKVSQEMRLIYVKAMGKEPDPKVLRAEAESFLARYGPKAKFRDIFGNGPKR